MWVLFSKVPGTSMLFRKTDHMTGTDTTGKSAPAKAVAFTAAPSCPIRNVLWKCSLPAFSFMILALPPLNLVEVRLSFSSWIYSIEGVKSIVMASNSDSASTVRSWPLYLWAVPSLRLLLCTETAYSCWVLSRRFSEVSVEKRVLIILTPHYYFYHYYNFYLCTSGIFFRGIWIV